MQGSPGHGVCFPDTYRLTEKIRCSPRAKGVWKKEKSPYAIKETKEMFFGGEGAFTVGVISSGET